MSEVYKEVHDHIVFYFSPTLFMITDIISPFLSWIILSIINGEKFINIIFNIIGYSIVLFSSFIYNEIIIFNFFDLNKNTKKYLDERQREELLSISLSQSDIKSEKNNSNENDIDNEKEKEKEND